MLDEPWRTAKKFRPRLGKLGPCTAEEVVARGPQRQGDLLP
jgi:hypothetical protein